MKIYLKVSTKVLAEPQTLEVSKAEAQRLIMLGVAEPEKKVEHKEVIEDVEPEKKVKKANKK